MPTHVTWAHAQLKRWELNKIQTKKEKIVVTIEKNTYLKEKKRVKMKTNLSKLKEEL